MGLHSMLPFYIKRKIYNNNYQVIIPMKPDQQSSNSVILLNSAQILICFAGC